MSLDQIWVMLSDVNEQDGYIAGPADTLEEAKQVEKEIIGTE
ncbi:MULTISPECIES: hypothetical protein [unclassified Paenibacillus]|nr:MULTISPECIES: hypothetical protein [unclassified Paenibacillus]MDF9842106.1 hypothetical protein [Paenibacillus sp. PastF-2]MDF9848640.1 hypothetical protein [Paenibacillus sp. PastM-2]MDF9855209.1 hypothetical protein [Paenibacillus sp. PastF-1]MDH6480479.1 hypothetical protein [Paenibacillus sp. PastH-2]MDH6507907.1 hypothetical protein [Paenibacillus sp. PastM-3]